MSIPASSSFDRRPSAAAPPRASQPFGVHLRHWRQQRRLSQLGLAQEADISTRHLSYVETGRAAPELVRQPINVLRLSLHPDGLAPRIANLAQWRAHLLERLHQQIAATGDAVLQALCDELEAYPAPSARQDAPGTNSELSSVVVPFQLATPSGVLSFISTTTIFGTPVDVTLQELAVESFFPADAQTAAALTALAAAPAG